MERIFTLFLILVIFSTISVAQGWDALATPASPLRYDDITFIDENTGWAADGLGSTVYKTVDEGEVWEKVFELDNIYMRSIDFLNPQIGFLGTLTPNFYKTVDGGYNWEKVEIPGIEAICGLNAVGDSTIYGCGAYFQPAYIIKSTDSGDSWTFIDMGEYASALIEVLFIDENTGYAGGGNDDGGTILKTMDGGETWEEIYNSGIPGELVWKLQILYSNPDVMFGAVQSINPLPGKLAKSLDGGKTWSTQDVVTDNPEESESYIQAVGFITEDYGWMGGHKSGLKLTKDGGKTWEETYDYKLWHINPFLVFDQNLVYAAGNSIYKYTDNISGTQNFPIVEVISLPKVTITPNPLSDQLNMQINFAYADHMVITVFDESGRKIKQLSRETMHTAGNRSYSFDFPYPAGLYYIHFHSDGGAHSLKVIKQ